MGVDLNNWLDAIADREMVYRRVDGVVSGKEFIRRVAQWNVFFAQRPEKRIAVYVDHCGNFSSLFLGLLQAGKDVLILPRSQAGFLEEIRDEADLFVLNGATASTVPSIDIDAIEPGDTGEDAEVACDYTGVIAFYTSGSTGQGMKVVKTLNQLAAEANTLHALWGSDLADACMFSTVSHQHIYGFLFGCFGPLLTGRPFWASRIQFPSELKEPLELVGSAGLVSSPAHLKRFPELVDQETLRSCCKIIFSSGGMLPCATAQRVAEVTGYAPMEVFGSTETGGVAWRQQDGAGEAPWTPLPGVSVDLDSTEGLLKVQSPFIAEEDLVDGWLTMSDKAILHKELGQFALLGRADRIVKVEQKRISLDEIERWLQSHPDVDDAAVVLLEANEQYSRDRLGAVIVLSDAGLGAAADKKRHDLIEGLRAHVLNFVDPVLAPKKWCFVPEVPKNEQGKRMIRSIKALFDRDAETLPEVIHTISTDDDITMTAWVPENLAYLEGHFDEVPIVAGVVQIGWVMHYADTCLGMSPNVQRVEGIKFYNLLLPGEIFRLQLTRKADHTVQFSLSGPASKYSSGRMIVDP